MIEPLPLVPATWTTGGSCARGLPSAASRRSIRPSDEVDRSWDGAASAARGRRRCGSASHGRSLMRRGAASARRGVRRGTRRARPRTARPQPAAAPARRLRLRSAALSMRASVSRSSLALHDHVDHAVLEQVFGALEALAAASRGSSARSRARRRSRSARRARRLDVAQHGEGGGDAAGGRVGQHARCRAGPPPCTCSTAIDGARHLHQRQDALLHARAARGGDDDQRRAPAAPRARAAATKPSPTADAHRAAHEVEVERRDHHRACRRCWPCATMSASCSPVLALRLLQPVGVALAVAEPQRIERRPSAARCADRRRRRTAAPGGASRRCACDGRNAGRPAGWPRGRGGRSSARRPGTCPRDSPARRSCATERADLRPDEVGEPVHGRLPSRSHLSLPRAADTGRKLAHQRRARACDRPGEAVPSASSLRADPVDQRRADHRGVGDLRDRRPPARGVRMPKPTATGRSVWRFRRATAAATLGVGGRARAGDAGDRDVVDEARRCCAAPSAGAASSVVGVARRMRSSPASQRRQAQLLVLLRRQVDDDQAVDAGGLAHPRRNAVDAVGVDRVEVAHQHDRRVVVAVAELAHQLQRPFAASCRPSSARSARPGSPGRRPSGR